MSWQPILEGALADRAMAAVTDIVAAIAARSGDPCAPADRAVFWAYVAGFDDREEIANHYDDALDELVASIADGYTSPALFGGLAGAGWELAHVSDAESAAPVLDPVDAALLAELGAARWEHDYELIGGLAGIAVYFLERGDSPAAKQGLARVFQHLVNTCERTADGVTWKTPPELMPEWHRPQAPGGYYNCGLAHGVPGVIAVLGRLAPRMPEAAVLAREAMRWLRAQRREAGFPSWVVDETVAPSARTAWCYGDPGIASACWSAARRLGDSEEMARALAIGCATRDAETAHVADAALCHGATGLAHLCNRWYHASGDPQLRDAARLWFERALAMRGSSGVAGFLRQIEGGWDASSNFLEGAIGIGLALLAATQPTEPAWDRLLACDIPLPGAAP